MPPCRECMFTHTCCLTTSKYLWLRQRACMFSNNWPEYTSSLSRSPKYQHCSPMIPLHRVRAETALIPHTSEHSPTPPCTRPGKQSVVGTETRVRDVVTLSEVIGRSEANFRFFAFSLPGLATGCRGACSSLKPRGHGANRYAQPFHAYG